MATRRLKADTAAASVAAMIAAAMEDIAPPGHVTLRPGDMPFWRDIVRSRARDEWADVDLALAGQLARCLADIEREEVALGAEGVLTVNDKGRQIVNPRVSVLDQFARRAQALARALRLGGRAAGRSADTQHARMLERKARRVLEESPDDSLLA